MIKFPIQQGAYVFEMDMNSSNFEERCLYQSGKIGGNKCKEP